MRGPRLFEQGIPSEMESTGQKSIRAPILAIPDETEDSHSFKLRLSSLLTLSTTHVYVDTSFLMWLTKIGSRSRQELFDWLAKNCDGRVHVPIWAAHEYLKHHVAGTIVTELIQKIDEIAALAGGTYGYLRPFMDDAFGEGAEDPAKVRAAARASLNGLDRLASTTRQWRDTYNKHSSEVIAFVNANAFDKTKLYNYFADLSALGAARFTGSIPPGFQDRRKGGSGREGSDGAAPADSNRYGDLVFWKEVLDHAKCASARAIVIFTNDRKNDWHLGGSDKILIEPELLALKKTWKPVPRTHPMLVMEAKLAADVDQVELLDSPYLAALLRDLVEEDVRSFADVAIMPDPTDSLDENRWSKQVEARRQAVVSRVTTAASKKEYLFADAPEISTTLPLMRRALLASRKEVSEVLSSLLSDWRANEAEQKNVLGLLDPEKIAGWNQNDLTTLARELHDRVIDDVPNFEEALVDLISNLDAIPFGTASCLYLGFLASMFLRRSDNASRLPPTSPCAELLFQRQGCDYAVLGVEAVAKRIRDNDFGPVYAPSMDKPKVQVTIDTEANSPEPDRLQSLRIGATELLVAAQSDERLRLASIFDPQHRISGDALLKKVCELFAVPFDQVDRTDAFETQYAFDGTIGFRRPVDISIPKESTLGQ
jgi:hypothetical protein